MTDMKPFFEFVSTLQPAQLAAFVRLFDFVKAPTPGVFVKIGADPRKPDFGRPVAVTADDNACAGCGGATFEPGDVVFLASGGPAMTIAKIVDGENAVVNWFDDEGVNETTLALATLEHCEPDGE